MNKKFEYTPEDVNNLLASTKELAAQYDQLREEMNNHRISKEEYDRRRGILMQKEQELIKIRHAIEDYVDELKRKAAEEHEKTMRLKAENERKKAEIRKLRNKIVNI